MNEYKVKECYRQETAIVAEVIELNTIRAKNLDNAKRRALADKAFSRTILVLADLAGNVLSTYKNGTWN